MTQALQSWALGAIGAGAAVATIAALNPGLAGEAGPLGVVVGFAATACADAVSTKILFPALGAPAERFLPAFARSLAFKFGLLVAAVVVVWATDLCEVGGVLRTILLSIVVLAHAEAARLVLAGRSRDRATLAATGGRS